MELFRKINYIIQPEGSNAVSGRKAQ